MAKDSWKVLQRKDDASNANRTYVDTIDMTGVLPRFLITGGTGFVGSHLCDELLKDEYLSINYYSYFGRLYSSNISV